jgi:hypothetical protein
MRKIRKVGRPLMKLCFRDGPQGWLISYIICEMLLHTTRSRPTVRLAGNSLARPTALSVCVYNLITGMTQKRAGSCYNRCMRRRGHNPEDWPTSNPQGRCIVYSAGAIALTLNQKQYVCTACHQNASTAKEEDCQLYSHHI